MKDKLRQMSEVFKALGDPTRLRIIGILSSNMKKIFVSLGWLKNLVLPNQQYLNILRF